MSCRQCGSLLDATDAAPATAVGCGGCGAPVGLEEAVLVHSGRGRWAPLVLVVLGLSGLAILAGDWWWLPTGRHLTRAEARAVARLRLLQQAQAVFQEAGVIDQDGNGVGEFGLLGELTGTTPMLRADGGTREGVTVPAVPDELRAPEVEGVLEAEGYRMRIVLPGGLFPTEDDGLARCERREDGPVQEKGWGCYAWPRVQGGRTVRAFYADQSGRIWVTDNEWPGTAYEGKNGPLAAAIFPGSGGPSAQPGQTDLPDVARGSDGCVWEDLETWLKGVPGQ